MDKIGLSSNQAPQKETIQEPQEAGTPIEPVKTIEPTTKKQQFKAPTATEVQDHFNSLGYTDDTFGERFTDYYEAKQWKIGRGNQKMKNWKLTVKQWIRSDKTGLVIEKSDLYTLDEPKILSIWNSLGCRPLKGVAEQTKNEITKTYKRYAKGTSNPKSMTDWLATYLSKGFKPSITNNERWLDDGKWSADLQYAVKYTTYDKVKNLAH